MLKHEISKQEDAVEKYFCEPFEKLEFNSMSDVVKRTLEMLSMAPAGGFEVAEEDKPKLIILMESGMEAMFTFKITDMRLFLLLAIISEENSDTAKMYLTYLQYWCKKNNQKELSIDTIRNVFPVGLPSKEDLESLWDGLKVEGQPSNLIDYRSAMVSIQLPKE